MREPYDYEDGKEDEGKDKYSRRLNYVPVIMLRHYLLLLSVPAYFAESFTYILPTIMWWPTPQNSLQTMWNSPVVVGVMVAT